MSGIHDSGRGAGRAEAGYRWPDETVTVARAEQERLHRWCGIEPQVFGGTADPALVARPPILHNTAAIRATRPAWGPVHVVQRIEQRRPIALDESLVLSGEITALKPHARGVMLVSRWSYRDAAGAEVFVVTPDVLMLDPQPAAGTVREARASAAVDDTALPTETLAHHQCTPSSTLGYCEGSENLIHLDPDYARGFGLRAPIIAGVQTINFLVAPLYRESAPGALAFRVVFRRPVFWDEALEIRGRRDVAGRLAATWAINEAGRVVADLDIVAPARLLSEDA